MTVKRLLTISAISIILSACGSDSNEPADTGTADAGNTADIDGSDDGGGTGSGTLSSGSDDSGGGDDTDVSQLSGNATLFGFVKIDDSNDQINASALFARFPTDFDTSELSPAQDECEVTQFNALDVTTEEFDFTIEAISAGDVVTFTSPAGTYVELIGIATSTSAGEIRLYSTDAEFYNIDTGLPAPAPTTLVVDIPGAEFPAFSAQSIPVVTRPEILSPAADEPVTPNTQFTWVAGTTDNSVINISATAAVFGSTISTTVNCVAIDDGSFTFDSATQSAMGSGFVSGITSFTGTGTGIDIERSATRFAQSGNAVLVLTGTAGN